MAFMEPEVYYGRYYSVESNHGETTIIPYDVHPNAVVNADLQDYVEGEIDDPDGDPEQFTGWLARMQAPGYMDCTDWSAHDNEAEALDYLREYYMDDEDDSDTDL